MKNKIIFILFIIFILSAGIISYFYNFSFANKQTEEVNSNVKHYVCPIGRTIGLKLYTNGVLVVGMSEIKSDSGESIKPYEGKNIKEGDMIKSINGKEISNTKELIEIVNESKGKEISIKFQRDNEELYTTINPIKTKDNNYMLGLWVRDAAAGLGTLTYYDENKKQFAALGHGIQDIDTGNLLKISNGEIVTSKVISISKGKKGEAGTIRGIIDDGISIGKVIQNNNKGIYGEVTNINYINKVKLPEVEVAQRKEVKKGKATVYCSLDNDEAKGYEIEIKKMFYNNSSDNKNMLIEITDKDLLEKTGGIIQGMSGSPIIQNGKFVGAVTNVLLNKPEVGYAIFADCMIN